MILILLIILAFILFFIFKIYFLKIDTIVGFTGAPGTSKTLNSVNLSLKLLRKNRLKQFFKNSKNSFVDCINIIFSKSKKKIFKMILAIKFQFSNKIQIYSNIPILVKRSRYKIFVNQITSVLLKNNQKISYFLYDKLLNEKILNYGNVKCFKTNKNNEIYAILKKDIVIDYITYLKLKNKYKNLKLKVKYYLEFSRKITLNVLLGRERIEEHSIVMLDEISILASQYQYDNPNCKDNLSLFFTFCRHFFGGYIIFNTQSSNKIFSELRYCTGTIYNLLHFSKIGLLYCSKIRDINIGEDIKSIEEKNTEDNCRVHFGLLPMYKHYNSRCFKIVYDKLPLIQAKNYSNYDLTSNNLVRIPTERFDKKQIKQVKYLYDFCVDNYSCTDYFDKLDK